MHFAFYFSFLSRWLADYSGIVYKQFGRKKPHKQFNVFTLHMHNARLRNIFALVVVLLLLFIQSFTEFSLFNFIVSMVEALLDGNVYEYIVNQTKKVERNRLRTIDEFNKMRSADVIEWLFILFWNLTLHDLDMSDTWSEIKSIQFHFSFNSYSKQVSSFKVDFVSKFQVQSLKAFRRK